MHMGANTPGAPKPNVVVHVRRRVVQVKREDAGVGSIVPVAAANESATAPFAFLIKLSYY